MAEDQELDNMEKQIEKIKREISLQAQINELKKLQGGGVEKQMPDEIQRFMKFLLPVGLVLAGIGLVFFMFLHDWTTGLTLDGLGAILIGLRFGLMPQKQPVNQVQDAKQGNVKVEVQSKPGNQLGG